MPIEKSAGAIIFRKSENKIFYLLLHYPRNSSASKNYWDLPKGHIKKEETEARAMRREVFEETGIKDLKLVSKFREVIKYFFKRKGKIIFKMVVFYLGETKNKEVKISDEHIDYDWLPYEKALKQLTFKNAKEILKKAHLYLIKRNV